MLAGCLGLGGVACGFVCMLGIELVTIGVCSIITR